MEQLRTICKVIIINFIISYLYIIFFLFFYANLIERVESNRHLRLDDDNTTIFLNVFSKILGRITRKGKHLIRSIDLESYLVQSMPNFWIIGCVQILRRLHWIRRAQRAFDQVQALLLWKAERYFCVERFHWRLFLFLLNRRGDCTHAAGKETSPFHCEKSDSRGMLGFIHLTLHTTCH